MAEDGEQPVALRVAEMATIMPDDAYHLVAVASNHSAICLELDSGRQRSRINEICEKDCYPSDFARIGRSGK
jgi:hypothetical protein